MLKQTEEALRRFANGSTNSRSPATSSRRTPTPIRSIQHGGEIEAEAKAARRVGFDAEVLTKAPLPFETAATLRFPDQAQFNPTQYLIGLPKAIKEAGGRAGL